MKIGMIIYSQTGNTLSTAEQVKDKLISSGHDVVLERIETEGEVSPVGTEWKITKSPDIKGYDAVVFAAPVMAFSLNPAMKKYLAELPESGNLKAVCFVTQAFPKPWLGGKNSLRKMRILCGIKKIEVLTTGIVNWRNKEREWQIEDLGVRTAEAFHS